MLTCIARSKQASDESPKPQAESGVTKNRATRSLTSQLKDMALKASGAYKPCNPCTGSSGRVPSKEYSGLGSVSGSDWTSERFRWSYRRTGSSNSAAAAGRLNLKGLLSGEGTPKSACSRRADPVVFVEESEPKEWVAQVEPGVLITFVSMPGGGNDIKRIRFSREMFNKWQAQRWWAENYEKVMELYNVQRCRHVVPLPTPPRSEDEKESPVTPPLTKERMPINLHRPAGMGLSQSSSDSFDHQSVQSKQYQDSGGLSSTPKLSSISVMKTETSSSIRTSSSREAEHAPEVSNSSTGEAETEWVEEDEAGVYVTVRALPSGQKELRRVRFSREKFGEMHARVWWEEHRARIHRQYL